MKIIDCHVHINQYERIGYEPDLEDRLELLDYEMRVNDVDYAIILSSYRVDKERPSTQEIIDAIKEFGYEKKMGVAAGYSIDNHTEKVLEEYDELIKKGYIKALKIYAGYEHYYPYDKRYNGLYSLAKKYEIPVMIHTGDTYSETAKLKYARPLHLDEVAVENRDVNIVMCHVGNPWLQEAQEVIYKNPNMYADISGLVIGDFSDYFEKLMKDKIKELIEYSGKPEFLMYGTDWPISSMDSYLSFVKELEMDEKHRKKLMYENAKEIFKINI